MHTARDVIELYESLSITVSYFPDDGSIGPLLDQKILYNIGNPRHGLHVQTRDLDIIDCCLGPHLKVYRK
jgi:hypothetical protein